MLGSGASREVHGDTFPAVVSWVYHRKSTLVLASRKAAEVPQLIVPAVPHAHLCLHANNALCACLRQDESPRPGFIQNILMSQVARQ